MPEAPAVAHVVLSLDVGGLERVILGLVRAGRRRGQQVDVVCLVQPGVLAAEAESLGARVRSAGKGPGLRMETISRLVSIFRALRPDVVHTHQVGALFYAGPAARAARAPVVVHTEHGKHYAARTRTRWLGRLAGRHAARFFCVSEDIAAEVAACRIIPARKIHVVRNGIDTERFRDRGGDATGLRCALGITHDAPVVGTVGRLSEVKRQDILIHAFARLRPRWPKAHLVLVGDGPLMGELRTLAGDLGLAACVHFAGYQAEPERYLGIMDIFALSSQSEGMPLAILEAWAAGLPVLASRVGGLPELIDDGRTGMLVEPGDVAALAAALESLLGDPGRAQELGQAGRHCVETRYDTRIMAASYEHHYHDLLAGRGVLA